jgi:hypothetical protein
MKSTVALLLACLFGTPAPASAWGAAAHRYLMGRAIDLLPPEIGPFFESNREELTWRVNDADLWRVVGWDEDAHHFLDLDAKEYGAYPFEALPRDYQAAVRRFGAATVKRYGLLPWRTEEMLGRLTQAFRSVPRGAPYASSDIVVFAAAVAHYAQDAHQPLHATINYDGQQTGQRGVHARFESALFERYRSQLSVTPARPQPTTGARDAIFDVLLDSYRSVAPLLAADRAAARGGRTYDDRYFEAFFSGTRALLEQRLARAATLTASLVLGAWIDAGRPALERPSARPPQLSRPPG